MSKCAATECENQARKVGYCNGHYHRLRRYGDPNTPRKRRPMGTGSLTVHGYWKQAGQYEHIRIVELALGRPLPAGAEVHHVNGNRHDNRNSNLVLCPSRAYHLLLHRRMKHCGPLADNE